MKLPVERSGAGRYPTMEAPDLSVAINGVTSIRFKPSLCRPDLKNVANSDLGFDEEVSRPLEIGDIC